MSPFNEGKTSQQKYRVTGLVLLQKPSRVQQFPRALPRSSKSWFYMIGIYSCSLLIIADLCAQVHARTYRRCVCEKCFPSLHFTDNVVDLFSNVAVGLAFKDFLITFRLVCHVLSTNRSCQTKGPKSKTEQLSAWIAYYTDPQARIQNFEMESEFL